MELIKELDISRQVNSLFCSNSNSYKALYPLLNFCPALAKATTYLVVAKELWESDLSSRVLMVSDLALSFLFPFHKRLIDNGLSICNNYSQGNYLRIAQALCEVGVFLYGGAYLNAASFALLALVHIKEASESESTFSSIGHVALGAIYGYQAKVHLFAEDFVLMTTLYNEKSAQRRAEYTKCLRLNAQNRHIKKIVVFFEGSKDSAFFKQIASVPKVSCVDITERPSYSLFFDYANKHLKGSNAIISNADIFFDSSLNRITKEYLKNTLVCLSRYDKKGFFYKIRLWGYPRHAPAYYASADSWIFTSPTVAADCKEFKIGTWRCEKFVNPFVKLGMALKNPCLDVRSYHEHASEVRNYTILNNHPHLPMLPVYASETSSPSSKKPFLEIWNR